MESTKDDSCTDRLRRLEGTPWERRLSVQRRYRWTLRRLQLGRTRDVGFRSVSSRSFPFPRATGRVFPYNAFVVVVRL
jgi:hypothetical protein